jgi:hypothetical protein
MDNNPFPRTWRLEMSILVASFDREADSPENVINMLHCFAPHPLRVAAGDVGNKDRLLAASGDMVDPILGAPRA